MKFSYPTRPSIIYYPDPILKTKCKPVNQCGPELHNLAQRMLNLMKLANGVGLAAPQVGLGIRMFVCNPTGKHFDDLVLVNPQIVAGPGANETPEGCLSIPGVSVSMRRATRVAVKATDALGQHLEFTATDLLARIIAHENDHLDGKLIIDRMSESDEIANRRAIKQLQDDHRATQQRKSKR